MFWVCTDVFVAVVLVALLVAVSPLRAAKRRTPMPLSAECDRRLYRGLGVWPWRLAASLTGLTVASYSADRRLTR